MPTTTRLSLRYPATSDTADVPRDIGNLASDIDKAAIFGKGTFANRPTSTVGSPGIDGRYYFATDTSRLYLDTGTSWVEVASGTDSVTSAMIAANAVGSDELAANAVTAAKVDATVAGYLGLSSGATTRRWTVSAPTERTTTSGSAVDVTGASVSIDDVLGNYVFVSVTAEMKNSGGDTTGATLNINVPTSASGGSADNIGPGNLVGVISTGTASGGGGGMRVAGTTYVKQSQAAIYVAPATRTTTVKLGFFIIGGGTGSIRNVVINVWQITP